MSLILDGTAGVTFPNSTTQAAASIAVSQSASPYATYLGYQALNSNTGANNTAVGYQSLYSNTTATNNTAVGYQAGYSNTTGAITAVGYFAAKGNTTGVGNSAFGIHSLEKNTTGNYNTALGGDIPGTNYGPLYNNTTGSSNTAIGVAALVSSTIADNNTAVGYQAGYSTTIGDRNTFLGALAGYSQTTNGFNTFVGARAGINSTGERNTFIGAVSNIPSVANYGCGELMTTGAKNTIIGGFNGYQGGLDIRTSSNNIVLSDGDGNPRGSCDQYGNWYFSTSVNTNILASNYYYHQASRAYSNSAGSFTATFTVGYQAAGYIFCSGGHYGANGYHSFLISAFQVHPGSNFKTVFSDQTANFGYWNLSWSSGVLTVTKNAGSYLGGGPVGVEVFWHN
jgi:hypothetical protein